MVDVQYRVLDNTVKKLKDMGDGTHAEVVHVGGGFTATIDGPIEATTELPPALITDNGGPSQRLRVDPGQTGFFAGRMFRTFHEFSIPSAGSLEFLFQSPINFIVWTQKIEIDQGALKVENIVNPASITGVWTELPEIPRNKMTEVPAPYTSQVQAGYGGGHTGGTVVDILRIRTNPNQGNSHSSNVVSGADSERGLSPGNYIVRLSALAGVTEATTGVISLSWEERP